MEASLAQRLSERTAPVEDVGQGAMILDCVVLAGHRERQRRDPDEAAAQSQSLDYCALLAMTSKMSQPQGGELWDASHGGA